MIVKDKVTTTMKIPDIQNKHGLSNKCTQNKLPPKYKKPKNYYKKKKRLMLSLHIASTAKRMITISHNVVK